MAGFGRRPAWRGVRRVDVRGGVVCHVASLLGGGAQVNAMERAVDNFTEIPNAIKVLLDKVAQARY